MALRQRYTCLFPVLLVLGTALMGASAQARLAFQRTVSADRSIETLFGDEIRQATDKVRWRGEPLTADTVYALALTGASWELAWGKEHLFSLARNESRNGGARRPRPHGNGNGNPSQEVAESYRLRDYRRVVSLASANFSLDEIAADPDLKEAVGTSFMELGQPERAFAIFAAPYHPRVEMKGDRRQPAAELPDSDQRFREGAFNAARQAGLQKEAVAFALSLLLEPGTDTPRIDTNALRYLERSGVDIDRVLLGVLEAPEHLRGLAAYTYAAADLLVLRATPRLLPIFVRMAESDDVYLRARALLGLGVIAYQAWPGDHAGWMDRILPVTPREYGISAGQRKLIAQKVQEAANSGEYRLRAASALALGLLGDNSALPLLQKLAKDRAYLLSPAAADRERERRIRFPVREAAAAALARYGVEMQPGGGELSGRSLDQARRGGQDVTNDRAHLRHDVVSALILSPTDTLPPFEVTRR